VLAHNIFIQRLITLSKEQGSAMKTLRHITSKVTFIGAIGRSNELNLDITATDDVY